MTSKSHPAGPLFPIRVTNCGIYYPLRLKSYLILNCILVSGWLDEWGKGVDEYMNISRCVNALKYLWNCTSKAFYSPTRDKSWKLAFAIKSICITSAAILVWKLCRPALSLSKKIIIKQISHRKVIQIYLMSSSWRGVLSPYQNNKLLYYLMSLFV